MPEITIEHRQALPMNRQQAEYVERKGLGHPDTICDALMESISVALSREYIASAGRVLHHNIDKGLLVAGQSSPALGGGTVDAPMRLVIGDRATDHWNGHRIPVEDIVETTVRGWFQKYLRFVDPQKHVILQNEIQPGSPELVDIFARQHLVANDTSAAVGYAPLTETERLVLETEKHLNSGSFKELFPEAGEDVKVMGVRRGSRLYLTIATAFVDRFVPDQQTYFQRKIEMVDELSRHLESKLDDLDGLEIQMNTLDNPERGLGGMYLTVLGTSAEGADGGQVGRGNRINGVISLNRPMSTEAAAGKNPVSHVGKIYNLLSHEIACDLYTSLDAVEEATVWMCSQIGRELDDPWSISVDLILKPDAIPADVEQDVRNVVENGLQNLPAFTQRLTQGEIPVW